MTKPRFSGALSFLPFQRAIVYSDQLLERIPHRAQQRDVDMRQRISILRRYSCAPVAFSTFNLKEVSQNQAFTKGSSCLAKPFIAFNAGSRSLPAGHLVWR